MKKTFAATIMTVFAVTMSSLTVFAAPQTMPDGETFDGEFYAQQYPDVVAVYGKDVNSLYKHYKEYGKAEGRKATAASPAKAAASGGKFTDGFDPAYYAQNNPDVVKALGTEANALYKHYINHGKKEGRRPCAAAAAVPAIGNHGKVVSERPNWISHATIYTYEDGFKIIKSDFVPSQMDKKYFIARTDFSDGLLDKDNNGIDDRDPLNDCGYTDLNHNCLADGAPTFPDFVPESEIVEYRLCQHNVVDGFTICNKKECVDWRERASHIVIH